MQSPAVLLSVGWLSPEDSFRAKMRAFATRTMRNLRCRHPQLGGTRDTVFIPTCSSFAVEVFPHAGLLISPFVWFDFGVQQ